MGYWRFGSPGAFQVDQTDPNYERVLAASDVDDGASQTVLLSERLLTSFEARNAQVISSIQIPEDVPERRVVWKTDDYPPPQYANAAAATSVLESFVADCRGGRSDVDWNRDPKFRLELVSNGYPTPGFVALDTPNTMMCVPTFSQLPPGDQRLNEDALGSFPASSLHPGGVNVSRFDGSAAFLSDAIDLAVWRALCSSSGSDFADE